MRIVIAAVGRARGGPERDLFDHYRSRLTRQVFSELQLKEVAERRSLPREAAVEQEGRLLLEAIPQGAVMVALDEAGRQMSSTELADFIAQQRDAGLRETAFVIGGADGLAPAVRAHARFLLSFGRATWPHLLVRALLAEQLYRVQTILTGHPYHRS